MSINYENRYNYLTHKKCLKMKTIRSWNTGEWTRQKKVIVTHVVSCHPDCISLNHNTVSRPTNV